MLYIYDMFSVYSTSTWYLLVCTLASCFNLLSCDAWRKTMSAGYDKYEIRSTNYKVRVLEYKIQMMKGIRFTVTYLSSS
jgi:hypothetical protein